MIIQLHQALQSGKPEAVIEKMVVGRLKKFYQETCFLEQAYVMDDKMSITVSFQSHKLAGRWWKCEQIFCGGLDFSRPQHYFRKCDYWVRM